jgi:hypothetical protein
MGTLSYFITLCDGKFRTNAQIGVVNLNPNFAILEHVVPSRVETAMELIVC